MGLTCWAGDRPRKTDVSTAKNYLSEDEIQGLNLIVSAYLDFAELQARSSKPMYMADWVRKLDGCGTRFVVLLLTIFARWRSSLADSRVREQPAHFNLGLFRKVPFRYPFPYVPSTPQLTARRPRMAAQSKHSASVVASLHNYLEGVAKKVADDLWGPQGPLWGTSLTELEDVALEARALFSKRLVEIGLERQAAACTAEPLPQAQVCPDCQRPFQTPPPGQDRSLETRAGDVQWQEPQAYCTRCRRAFFPSKQEPGH
jgi:hypothetical protein